MSTSVKQTYSPSLNVSVTTKDGVLVGVTQWVSGHPAAATERFGSSAYVERPPRTPRRKSTTFQQAVEFARRFGPMTPEGNVGPYLSVIRDIRAQFNMGLAEALDAVNLARHRQNGSRPLLGRPIRFE